MIIAITEVFLNSQHRLLSLIYHEKNSAKFGNLAHNKMISKQMKNMVYNSFTVDQCDQNCTFTK